MNSFDPNNQDMQAVNSASRDHCSRSAQNDRADLLLPVTPEHLRTLFTIIQIWWEGDGHSGL